MFVGEAEGFSEGLLDVVFLDGIHLGEDLGDALAAAGGLNVPGLPELVSIELALLHEDILEGLADGRSAGFGGPEGREGVFTAACHGCTGTGVQGDHAGGGGDFRLDAAGVLLQFGEPLIDVVLGHGLESLTIRGVRFSAVRSRRGNYYLPLPASSLSSYLRLPSETMTRVGWISTILKNSPTLPPTVTMLFWIMAAGLEPIMII